jgi:hypothetical protein
MSGGRDQGIKGIVKVRCGWCDAAVPLVARACPACGTANSARRTLLGAVVAAAILLPAIGLAIYAGTRWERPLITADNSAEQPLPSQPVAGTDDDFSWLAAAMKACDDKASSEPNALHFLVVPVAFDAKDLDQWRRVALNRIGNAMVLPSNDMLDGLRRKTLTIAPGEYTFGIRDGKTQAVRKWPPASGVKWLSAPGGEDVALFTMQYKPNGKGSDDNWGNPIVHQKGNCYWVNVAFEE